MKDRYMVKINHCNCHPETCCCNPYKIVDTKNKNKKVATFYSQNTAKDLAKKLNKKVNQHR